MEPLPGQHFELKEILNEVATTPYNSVASIYRACGAEWDSKKYGNNCIGMLRILKDTLPPSAQIQYLTTAHKDQIHVAAIVDGSYTDPFLSQTSPLPVGKMMNGDVVSVPSAIANQRIAGDIDGETLRIRLIKSFPSEDTSVERTLIEYQYNLSSALDVIPEDAEVVKLGTKYQYIFITNEGVPVRVEYDIRKDDLNILTFSCDFTGSNDELKEYAEASMKEMYGLDFDSLVECFRSANEMEKYIRWNRSTTY